MIEYLDHVSRGKYHEPLVGNVVADFLTVAAAHGLQLDRGGAGGLVPVEFLDDSVIGSVDGKHERSCFKFDKGNVPFIESNEGLTERGPRSYLKHEHVRDFVVLPENAEVGLVKGDCLLAGLGARVAGVGLVNLA